MDLDQAHKDELHRAMGEALTRWQYIETALYVIAHCILGTEQKLSSVVFFLIRSAETKLDLVDRLCAAASLPPPLPELWKEARKAVKHHLASRNAIAHYEANMLDLTIAQDASAFPVALAQHHLQPNNSKDDTVSAIYVEGLRDAAEGYLVTARALLLFARTLPGWQQHSASLPPRLRQVLQTFRTAGTPGAPEPPGSPSPA